MIIRKQHIIFKLLCIALVAALITNEISFAASEIHSCLAVPNFFNPPCSIVMENGKPRVVEHFYGSRHPDSKKDPDGLKYPAQIFLWYLLAEALDKGVTDLDVVQNLINETIIERFPGQMNESIFDWSALEFDGKSFILPFVGHRKKYRFFKKENLELFKNEQLNNMQLGLISGNVICFSLIGDIQPDELVGGRAVLDDDSVPSVKNMLAPEGPQQTENSYNETIKLLKKEKTRGCLKLCFAKMRRWFHAHMMGTGIVGFGVTAFSMLEKNAFLYSPAWYRISMIALGVVITGIAVISYLKPPPPGGAGTDGNGEDGDGGKGDQSGGHNLIVLVLVGITAATILMTTFPQFKLGLLIAVGFVAACPLFITNMRRGSFILSRGTSEAVSERLSLPLRFLSRPANFEEARMVRKLIEEIVELNNIRLEEFDIRIAGYEDIGLDARMERDAKGKPIVLYVNEGLLVDEKTLSERLSSQTVRALMKIELQARSLYNLWEAFDKELKGIEQKRGDVWVNIRGLKALALRLVAIREKIDFFLEEGWTEHPAVLFVTQRLYGVEKKIDKMAKTYAVMAGFLEEETHLAFGKASGGIDEYTRERTIREILAEHPELAQAGRLFAHLERNKPGVLEVISEPDRLEYLRGILSSRMSAVNVSGAVAGDGLLRQRVIDAWIRQIMEEVFMLEMDHNSLVAIRAVVREIFQGELEDVKAFTGQWLGPSYDTEDRESLRRKFFGMACRLMESDGSAKIIDVLPSTKPRRRRPEDGTPRGVGATHMNEDLSSRSPEDMEREAKELYDLSKWNIARGLQDYSAFMTLMGIQNEFEKALTHAEVYVDAGCGIGRAAVEAANLIPQLRTYGIDVVEWGREDVTSAYDEWESFEEMRRKVAAETIDGKNKYTFKKADITTVKLEEKADFITSFFTLQYLDDPIAAFANLYNQLNPGGVMLVTFAASRDSDTVQYYQRIIDMLNDSEMAFATNPVEFDVRSGDASGYFMFLQKNTDETLETGLELTTVKSVTVMEKGKTLSLKVPVYRIKDEPRPEQKEGALVLDASVATIYRSFQDAWGRVFSESIWGTLNTFIRRFVKPAEREAADLSGNIQPSKKQESKGRSLILYADDILNDVVFFDFEYAITQLVKDNSIFSGGKIVLYVKDNNVLQKAETLKEYIQNQSGNKTEVIIITKTGTPLENIPQEETGKEANKLLDYARAKGVEEDSVVALIKTHKGSCFNAGYSHKVPVVMLNLEGVDRDEKAVFSLAGVINMALYAQRENGAIFQMIDPFDTIDLGTMYEQYLLYIDEILTKA